MKNIALSVLIIVFCLVFISIIFNNVDENACKNKKLISNEDFKLNFKNNKLKCNCNLNSKPNTIENFDSQNTNTVSSYENVSDKLKENNTSINNYSKNILYNCYYNLSNLSAEQYYENRYDYPIIPEFQSNNSPINNASINEETDNILGSPKTDNSYIFSFN